MTQVAISPTDLKVRERIRALKCEVKKNAQDLRDLKLCRKTKHRHPNRDSIMKKFKCEDASDLYYKIHFMKQDATINLIAYGRLRGKEHTVKDPEQWDYAVGKILEE